MAFSKRLFFCLILTLVCGPLAVRAEQVGAGATATIKIPIRDLVDFNFKSKQEIYDLRTKYVSQVFTGNYKPSESVFGQIQSGRPWWGMQGQCTYGKGEKSILGLSEESRFVANPFLFVGLEDGCVSEVSGATQQPAIYYPKPAALFWNVAGRFAGVQYDLSSYWAHAASAKGADYHKINLIAFNARDLGWNYLYVSPEQSKNVTAPPQLVKIIQFIHTGGSCGYPGGCNNMSPDQHELQITVSTLPARAYIKLWREAPANVSDPPDLVFLISMI